MTPTFPCLGSYEYPNCTSIMRDLLESYIEESFLILDAGCGHRGGYITKLPSNVEGIGLDVSRENIKQSVKISKTLGQSVSSFLVADIQKMPFRENIFDFITCQDVLEHVRNRQDAINEMAFALKRGGIMLIRTSNCFNPVMLIDEILPKSVSDMIIHVFRGTREYDRCGRFNSCSLNAAFLTSSLKLRKLLMVGEVPWTKKGACIVSYSWIIFDKLTNIGFLRNFKEMMITLTEK